MIRVSVRCAAPVEVRHALPSGERCAPLAVFGEEKPFGVFGRSVDEAYCFRRGVQLQYQKRECNRRSGEQGGGQADNSFYLPCIHKMLPQRALRSRTEEQAVGDSRDGPLFCLGKNVSEGEHACRGSRFREALQWVSPGVETGVFPGERQNGESGVEPVKRPFSGKIGGREDGVPLLDRGRASVEEAQQPGQRRRFRKLGEDRGVPPALFFDRNAQLQAVVKRRVDAFSWAYIRNFEHQPDHFRRKDGLRKLLLPGEQFEDFVDELPAEKPAVFKVGRKLEDVRKLDRIHARTCSAARTERTGDLLRRGFVPDSFESLEQSPPGHPTMPGIEGKLSGQLPRSGQLEPRRDLQGKNQLVTKRHSVSRNLY